METGLPTAGSAGPNAVGLSNELKKQGSLSQQEIDAPVIAQADDDAAWSAPVQRHRTQERMELPADLATRATFLAPSAPRDKHGCVAYSHYHLHYQGTYRVQRSRFPRPQARFEHSESDVARLVSPYSSASTYGANSSRVCFWGGERGRPGGSPPCAGGCAPPGPAVRAQLQYQIVNSDLRFTYLLHMLAGGRRARR